MSNENENNDFDLDSFLKEKSGELSIPVDVYKSILISSFTQCDTDLIALEKGIEQQNHEDIQAIAHRIKGVYANLRIDHVSKIAASIDELSKAESDIAEISKLCPQLKSAYLDFKSKIA